MNIDELGSLLRTARLAQNISQETLCKDALISRATLSQFENGHLAEIGVNKIMQICSRLGLRLSLEQATQRPTLRQLVRQQKQALPVEPERPVAPVRKRARKVNRSEEPK
jgi:transcriptional regulator with XRE-family HTH domain